MKGAMMFKRKRGVLDQAQRLGRETGLQERFDRYREQRDTYERNIRGRSTPPATDSVPQSERQTGFVSRRVARTGTGLF